MINNLVTKKYLGVVLVLLVFTVGVIACDIPGLRQIVGFIFLSLVPGILILRILRIHGISAIEGLVYSVGLSLAFVVFTGLFVNFVFPLFGVSRPISFFPFITTFTGFILILGAIAYKRDKGFLPQAKRALALVRVPPPSFLLLILLPLLAILGALLVNYYQNNILLLIFILIVAAIVGLVAFNKFIPERAYPLAIVMIAIALLLQSTLYSSFISGPDIQVEYWSQNFVAQSGYWDPARGGNLNTSLGLVMLCPIYSMILNMDTVWVFKIIYPLLFCLVPLALFHIYREQIGSKGAFFAAFFFTSIIIFFNVMLQANRQQVAELFFALLLLLVVSRKLTQVQKSALAIIFVILLPLSHYGLAYIFLFYLIVGWLLLGLMRSKVAPVWWRNLAGRFSSLPANPAIRASTPKRPLSPSLLRGTLISIALVFTLGWYIYTSSATAFSSFVMIPQHLYSNIGEFLNPLARESLVAAAVGLDFPLVSTLGKAFRIIQYITQFLIIAGFIRLFLKPKGFKFRAEFIVLIIVSALILLACILLPYFSGHLEVERFYHITLFLLSPLCILGGETIWQGLSRLFKSISPRLKFKRRLALPSNPSSTSPIYFRFLTLAVLIPYFLFNTGFFFEIAKSELYDVIDTPSSEALSSYRMDMKVCNYRENAANEWLVGVVDGRTPIYADIYAVLSITGLFVGHARAFPLDTTRMPENTYIYLKTWNLEKNEVLFVMMHGQRIWLEHISFDALPELHRLVNSKNLIYNNGGAQLFAPLSGW